MAVTYSNSEPSSSGVAILAESGVATGDITGSAEERTFATVTVPAGVMGPNSVLQVECLSHQTNNPNGKTVRFKIDDDTFAAIGVKSTSGTRLQKNLYGAGATNAQRALPASANDLASTSGAQQLKAYDFAADRTLTITGKLDVESDSLGLDHYRVAVLNPGVADSGGIAPDDAGVHPDTQAARDKIAACFDACWTGWTGQPLISSGQPVTTLSELKQRLTNLPNTEPGAWYDIVLDSGAPAANWTGNVSLEGAAGYAGWAVGHYYGSPTDRASHGGGVLIRSSDPARPVMIRGGVTIYGYRGLHFRDLVFQRTATAPTNAACDQAVMMTVTSNSTRRDAPVVRFEACGFGTLFDASVTDERLCGVGIAQTALAEQIDVINCRFLGCQTAIKGVGCRYVRIWGNDFQKTLGDNTIFTNSVSGAFLKDINSAFGDGVNGNGIAYNWRRLNTARNMVDLPDLSHEHTDHNQIGTGGDHGDSVVLHEYECFYGERETCTDARYVNYAAIPTDGATITIAGVTFTYRKAPAAPNDILIGASTKETLANGEKVIEAAGIPQLQRITPSGSQMQVHFIAGQLQEVAASAGATVASPVRAAGGTQFLYHDDTPDPYTITVVAMCCIGTANDGIGSRFYNGSAIQDRCTFGRPGVQPWDATPENAGFNQSYDFNPYASNDRKTSNSVVDTTIRASVMGMVVDGCAGDSARKENGTFVTGSACLTLVDNEFVPWTRGTDPAQAPAAKLAGAFDTDAQGRVHYAFTDDGAASQQDFREALYDQLKLADPARAAACGAPDPRNWPEAPATPAIPPYETTSLDPVCA